MTIKEGDKLWYVPNRGEPCEVTVAKVGRKWFEITDGWRASRFSIEGMAADGRGYTSPGRCYLSRQEYDRIQHEAAELQRIRRRIIVRHGSWVIAMPPECVEKIHAVLDEFGIETGGDA